VAHAAAAQADEVAFVEASAGRTTYYVGEPVRVRLALGVRRELLEDGLVQLFRRPLDVPMQLTAPWLRGLPGAPALPEAPASTGVTLALNEEVVRVHASEERISGGARYAVFELERAFLPERAGELVFQAPELRLAWATRFEDDFLDGRVPADRRELVVHGAPLTLSILPLPEEGRPPGFAGAVGRFSVSAAVQPYEVDLGQSMELTLTVGGEGQRGEPPRLDLPGFHVRGVIRRGDAFVYDVAPRTAEVSEVPALPFAYFDPGPPAGYVSAASEPLPIRVRPASSAASGAPAPATDSGPGREQFPLRTVAIMLGVLVVVHLLLGAWRRMRRAKRES
jgi:hypothetical protein